MKYSSRWLGPFAIAYLFLPFVLLTIALVNFRSLAQTNPPLLPPSEYDQRLLVLDKEGIETAYREQVKLLFQNWMKDPNVGQPHRALTGIRNAQRAYIISMDGIKRREQELRTR